MKCSHCNKTISMENACICGVCGRIVCQNCAHDNAGLCENCSNEISFYN